MQSATSTPESERGMSTRASRSASLNPSAILRAYGKVTTAILPSAKSSILEIAADCARRRSRLLFSNKRRLISAQSMPLATSSAARICVLGVTLE